MDSIRWPRQFAADWLQAKTEEERARIKASVPPEFVEMVKRHIEDHRERSKWRRKTR